MKKMERLACLYLAFINNPAGLSFADLKEFLPAAYQGDADSARRKFERDKDDLRKLGMDLEFYPEGASRESGIAVQGNLYAPRDELRRLPEISLNEEEARALAAALFRAVEENRYRDLARAMTLRSAALKLLYRSPGAMLAAPLGQAPPARLSESRELTAKLEIIHAALAERRVLKISYPDASGVRRERLAEGRGLVAHRGRWCLAAHCRLAGAVRSFYVDRIGEASLTEERYRPARDFNIRDFSLHPLALRIHEERPARLLLAEDREELFSDLIAGLPRRFVAGLKRRDNEVSLTTTNQEALFSWMTRHPGAVERLGPESLRRDYITYRETFLRRHRDVAGEASA